jgi:hypothetical protein
VDGEVSNRSHPKAIGRGRFGSECAVSYHHPDKRGKPYSSRAYTGEVDYFGVYCPDNDAVYLVSANDVADCRNMVSLRLVPPRNKQVRKIRWASDYEIKPG